MSARLRLLSMLAGAGVLGCSGEPLTAGFDEPLRISGAQFEEGRLPGLPPLTADEINAGEMVKTPAASGINVPNAIIPPREPGRAFSGFASPDSVAVGVRFKELGTGYWLLPTRNADSVNDGALEWSFRAAFAPGLPAGRHELLVAAVDAQGRSGNQQGVTLCLRPEIPDNDNVCIPQNAPPALVVSLGWDAGVDLDLRVVTPTGKVVDPKHPTTAEKDSKGKLDLSAKGIGALDYDSFADCRPDGRRRESLIFQDTPPAGTYLVYAGIFDACGEPGVTFDVSLHVPGPSEDGEGERQVETFRTSAQLSAIQADGGAKLGTYITNFVVQ